MGLVFVMLRRILPIGVVGYVGLQSSLNLVLRLSLESRVAEGLTSLRGLREDPSGLSGDLLELEVGGG